MKRTTCTILAFGVLACASPAMAQSAVVTFNATILPSCALVVGTPGVLAVNSDNTELDSSAAGGVSGTATVLTTGLGYKLQIDPPSGFRLAPSGGQPDTIDVDYQAGGVTLGIITDVTAPLNLNLGLTTLDIDMVANKTSGFFPSGVYAADVTVRCTT